jgi:hypothetical protein
MGIGLRTWVTAAGRITVTTGIADANILGFARLLERAAVDIGKGAASRR